MTQEKVSFFFKVRFSNHLNEKLAFISVLNISLIIGSMLGCSVSEY